MKKLLAALIFSAILLTTACANANGANESSQQTDSQQSVSAQAQQTTGKDYTVKLDSVLNLDDYKDELKHTEKITFEACHAFNCSTFDKMIEQSTDVIKAKVISVKYTHALELPYTVFDVEVLETYKGSLQKGDIISAIISDGYITMYDYATLGNLEHRYSDIPIKEQKRRLVEIKGYFSEPYPAVGDIDFLPLLVPGFDNRTNSVPGTYWPINDIETVYKLDKNGKFTRLYETLNKNGKYDIDKNNIDSFTPEWLENKMQSIKSSE